MKEVLNIKQLRLNIFSTILSTKERDCWKEKTWRLMPVFLLCPVILLKRTICWEFVEQISLWLSYQYMLSSTNHQKYIHHLLSNPLYKLLLKACNEEKGTINELMSIKDCRTSIELFERLIHQCGFSVTDQKLWFINPHYKQKFHLTPRLLPHWVWRVKYIRNFFTTSCWYVLSIGNKEKF